MVIEQIFIFNAVPYILIKNYEKFEVIKLILKKSDTLYINSFKLTPSHWNNKVHIKRQQNNYKQHMPPADIRDIISSGKTASSTCTSANVLNYSHFTMALS